MTFEIFDSFKRFCFICFVELKAIFVSKNTTWQQKTLDYFPKHLLNATVVADVGSQEIVTDNQLRFYINILWFYSCNNIYIQWSETMGKAKCWKLRLKVID